MKLNSLSALREYISKPSQAKDLTMKELQEMAEAEILARRGIYGFVDTQKSIRSIIRGLKNGVLQPVSDYQLAGFDNSLTRAQTYYVLKGIKPFIVRLGHIVLVFDEKQPSGAKLWPLSLHNASNAAMLSTLKERGLKGACNEVREHIQKDPGSLKTIYKDFLKPFPVWFNAELFVFDSYQWTNNGKNLSNDSDTEAFLTTWNEYNLLNFVWND